jgi:hypothetical protein
MGFSQNRILRTICLGWLQTAILLICLLSHLDYTREPPAPGFSYCFMHGFLAEVTDPEITPSPANNCCFTLNSGTEIQLAPELQPRTSCSLRHMLSIRQSGIWRTCRESWKDALKDEKGEMKRAATTKSKSLGLRNEGSVGFGTNKWVQLMHAGVCYFGFSLDLCFDSRLFLQSVSSQQAVGKWRLFQLNHTFVLSSHT